MRSRTGRRLARAARCWRPPAPGEGPRSPQLELPDLKRPAEEWLREEPIRLLRDYVRIDTTPEEGRAPGAEFLRRLLRVRGHRDRDRLPGPRPLQRARAPAGPAPRGRAAAAQPHRRGRRLPAVLEGGRALRGHDQARLSLRPRRLRHEVARPRAGPRDARASSGGASCRRRTSSFSPRPTRRSASAGAPAGCSSTGRSGSPASRRSSTRAARPRSSCATSGSGGSRRCRRATRCAEFEAAVECAARSSSPRAGRSSTSTPVAPHPHVVVGFDMLANHLTLAPDGPAAAPRPRRCRIRRSSRSCRTATPASSRRGSTGRRMYQHPEPPGRLRGVSRSSRCRRAWTRRRSCGRSSRTRREQGLTVVIYVRRARSAWRARTRRRSRTCCSASPRPAIRASRSAPFRPSAATRPRSCFRERGIPTYGFSPIADEHHGRRPGGTATTSGSSCATT